MMTYTDDKINFGAYTYGLERIEVEAIDNTRPDSQDPLYYLYDGLGSVAYMVKPDGNMRDHYRYDEFGKPAPGNSKQSPDGDINLNNTFGYTGEMWEEESGLLYLRARYYEPETGRFLSRDTYAGNAIDPLSLNRYAYVGNNPLNYIDPTGYVTISVDGKLKISSDKAWMTRNISDKRVYAPLQDLAKAVKASYKPNGSNKALVTYNGMPREFTFNQYNPDKDWWVRDFADKLGIEVEWNQAKQNVNLKTVKGKREDKKHFPDQGTGQSTGGNLRQNNNNSSLDLGSISTAISIAQGVIKNPAAKDGLNFVDKRITTIEVVSTIADEANKNPKQSIGKSVIKGGLKAAGHAGTGYVQGDLIAATWSLHFGAAVEAPPVTPVLAVSAGGITTGIVKTGEYVNKGWDWLIDKMVR